MYLSHWLFCESNSKLTQNFRVKQLTTGSVICCNDPFIDLTVLKNTQTIGEMWLWVFFRLTVEEAYIWISEVRKETQPYHQGWESACHGETLTSKRWEEGFAVLLGSLLLTQDLCQASTLPSHQAFKPLTLKSESLTSLVFRALDFGSLMLVVSPAHQLAGSSMDFSDPVSMVLTL